MTTLKINYSFFLLFLISIGVGFSLMYVLSNIKNRDISFVKVSERTLGDQTENSLYQIKDSKSVYYLATNKVLAPNKLSSNVRYLSSDIFWNPERCAQMLSFYDEESIYFFETVVVNPEENGGEQFTNRLHIYKVLENTLTTYQTDKYINLVGFRDNRNSLIYRDKSNHLVNAYFDIGSLIITKDCDYFSCNYLGDDSLLELQKQRPRNIIDFRPYIFKIKDSLEQTQILSLDDSDNVYHFLIGF